MSRNKYFLWSIVGIFAFVLLFIVSHSVVISSSAGLHWVWVETAKNETAWEKGLMGRSFLPSSHGMLFIFPQSRTVSLWMKDTLIPLDLVFLNDQKQVIGIESNAQPCPDHSGSSCITYPSPGPARYVIELKAGELKEKQILVGSQAYWLLY